MDGSEDLPHLISLPAEAATPAAAISARDIGFVPHRMFWISGVPAGAVRGAHAHRRLRQCQVCFKGAVTVELEKAGERFSFRLDRPDRGLLVPPGCWQNLVDFADGSVLAVFASEPYDEAEYLRDYGEFRAWEAEAAQRPIPYLDLARGAAALEGEYEPAIARLAGSGRGGGEREVASFEEAFAAYLGVAHAVGVGNGLDALALGLLAKGIGRGDSVLVPAHTAIATALAVSHTGAEPIFVDVEADTFNLDPDAAAAALRPDTRAMIPVHLYGHPADMPPLRRLTDRHGLFVLEDAAQAHGARHRGRHCGSLGDAAGFSFYPTKNLGALGDAGALVSDDAGLVSRARRLGHSRLDPIQAAVLATGLRHLDEWNARRGALAERYRRGLHGLDGVIVPAPRPWALPAWHIFALRVIEGRRGALRRHLSTAGIGTGVHYPRPIHLQPAYAAAAKPRGSFPVAERLAEEIVSLPLSPFHTETDIDTVIRHIREFFGGQS